jgi:hypothetical protein
MSVPTTGPEVSHVCPVIRAASWIGGRTDRPARQQRQRSSVLATSSLLHRFSYSHPTGRIKSSSSRPRPLAHSPARVGWRSAGRVAVGTHPAIGANSGRCCRRGRARVPRAARRGPGRRAGRFAVGWCGGRGAVGRDMKVVGGAERQPLGEARHHLAPGTLHFTTEEAPPSPRAGSLVARGTRKSRWVSGLV